MRWSTFQRYLLPGFVFQSVIIAGGYGTGREIVEFFLSYGPLPGLLGMVLITTVIFSLVAAISYELARRFRLYDYRSFFKRLLGPAWVLFELAYITLMFLVIAVIGAAAGSIVQEIFGLPYAAGVIVVMSAIAGLLFMGSAPIERALAGWSFVLYAAYIVFFVWSLVRFGDQIAAAFGAPAAAAGGNWVLGGMRYAAYNVSAVPVVLFAVRHIKTRREAISAGLLTGPIGIFPGLLFYIVMAGQYPEIIDRAVPVNHLLELLGSRAFQIIFQVVLFGTLVETGTGMIHAVNERLAATFEEKGKAMPRQLRSLTAVVFLGVAILLSRIGLVDLIARGYGSLTWLFLAVYVLPILTFGVWLLVRRPRPRPAVMSSRLERPD